MKKLYIILGSLIFVIGIACIILLLLPNKKDTKLNQYNELTEVDNIDLSSSSSDAEEEGWEPYSDFIFVDASQNSIPDEATKDKLITEISDDVTSHVKYIFTYNGYTDDYQNTLEANITEKDYNLKDADYVEEICRSFEDKSFKSEPINVYILRMTVGKGFDNDYTAEVSGYIEVKASSNKMEEGEYYIPFEDQIIDNNGIITRSKTTFNYIYKKDDFEISVRWTNDLAELNYNGTAGFPFKLSEYDPTYDEVQEQLQKQKDEYDAQVQSETDAEESE